jgi:hypothetical protein
MNALKWTLAVATLLVLAWAGLSAYGAARWRARTAELLARLDAARQPPSPARYDAQRELDGLPAPVQRYFQAVLTDGAPIVAAASVEHGGSFNMGQAADAWKPFTSQQRVVTRAPGFVWDGTVSMWRGVPVHVHDAYIAGEGRLQPALLGLLPLADLRGGGDIAVGEFMRFFAEAAWYPTALLPSQGVLWEPVDDTTARATLRDGPVAVTLTFRFDGDGLIERVRADARGRTVGKRVVPTPWEGRWSNYRVQDGMRVPMTGEVAWLLPEGARPYWRGTITSLRYDFAR